MKMQKEDHTENKFLSVLVLIAKEKKSGVVQLKQKSGNKRLFFHKGLLRMISIPGGAHPLKRALLDQGLFDEKTEGR